jgi:hypothetical protein
MCEDAWRFQQTHPNGYVAEGAATGGRSDADTGEGLPAGTAVVRAEQEVRA